MKDTPPTEATELASAELEVIHDIAAHRARALDGLAAHLRAANDRLAQLETQMDIAKMRQDTAKALTEFEAIRHQVETEVASVRGRARQCRIEYEEFRARNKLERSPRESGRHEWKITFLFGAIFIESLLNGLFFRTGSDSGLIGGVAIALSLSFINVVIFGILGGLLFRYAHRSQWWWRIPAILFVPPTVAALITLNLFVAHYRDVFTVSDTPPNLILIVHGMIDVPMGLASIESLLLFALGLFCGVIGMYEFYSFVDPYPGYTAVYRRLTRALDAHANTRDELLEVAKGTRDDLLKDLNSAMQSLRGAAEQRRAALDTRSRFIASYEAHEQDIEQTVRRLLGIYREANTDARHTPAPAHFKEVFTFPDRGLDHAAIRSLLIDPPAPPAAEVLVAELDTLRTGALEAFGKTIALLPAEAT